MIKDVKIIYEAFGDNFTFGHKFTLSYNVSKQEELRVLWFEKADIPYDIGNAEVVLTEPGLWGELCCPCKSYSPVFKDILDCYSGMEGERDVEMEDDPHIGSNASSQRTLDFYIVLKDNESAYIITATQMLKMNDSREITAQSFRCDINEATNLSSPELSGPTEPSYDVTAKVCRI